MEKTEERKTAEDIVGKIFTKDRRKFKTQKEFLKYLKNLLLSSIEIQQTAIRRLKEANEDQKTLIEVTNLIERLFSETKIKEFLLNAKKSEVITSEERDKLTNVYNTFRGSKIAKKNRAPYRGIIAICEEYFIKKDLGEQWSNAVKIYGNNNHYSSQRRGQLYTSFMKFKGERSIETMKNLLSKVDSKSTLEGRF